MRSQVRWATDRTGQRRWSARKGRYDACQKMPYYSHSDARPQQRLRRSLEFPPDRSEEHTSELQSLMRISYAVFCLKKKLNHQHIDNTNNHTLYVHTLIDNT